MTYNNLRKCVRKKVSSRPSETRGWMSNRPTYLRLGRVLQADSDPEGTVEVQEHASTLKAFTTVSVKGNRTDR